MTPLQFCIARAYHQLRTAKRQRGLTDQEAKALAFCEQRVAEYIVHEPHSVPVPTDPQEYQPHRDHKLPSGELDRRALKNWPAEWGKRT